MGNLWQDLRYAVRVLAKSPGFTTVSVLTLALGIGANTAIFSLIDAVMLRSLPVRDPQRLVVFQWTAHNSPKTKGYYSYMPCASTDADSYAGEEHGCSFSYPVFRRFQSLENAFSGVAALGGDVGLNLRGNGPTSFVRGELVSGGFFGTLGIDSAIGRTFGPSDDAPGAPPVAELGYGYWQSAFGGDPTVVGRTIWLNSVPVTIVGVAAKEFPNLNPASSSKLWVPLSLKPQLGQDLYGSIGGDHPSLLAGDDNWWVYIVGRLKRGVTRQQSESAVDTLFRNNVAESRTLFNAGDAPQLSLIPAPQAISGLRDRFSRPLTILMIAVCLVLLITCFNVAGLMLARSATRQRELAVRLALGAGRARIARQLLTESTVLALAGGASGILLAYWSARSLVAFMSRGGNWPSHLSAQLDLRVLAFTVAVSLLTGVSFGLAPAFRGMRTDVTPVLKGSVTSFARGTSRGRWLNPGGVLVIAQVALSVVILAGAALVVRTLKNLKSINPGFNSENVLLFGIDPALNGYSDAKTDSLYAELQQRLGTQPSVRSVSYSYDALLSGNLWSTSFRIDGETQNKQDTTEGLSVGPKFFETLGIPLLAGRSLTPVDFALPPNSTWCPVVINKAFDRRFFQNENPLGRRISGFGGKGAGCEIIGIVGDAKYQALRKEIEPTIYIPEKGGGTTFEIRTVGDSATIIPAIRSIVTQLDNNLPIFNIETQSAVVDRSIFQERLIARLSSLFGGISLLLACVGLYGLLSYGVTRQTREIGVRIALGAKSSDILRFVVSRGIGLSTVGVLLGVPIALGVTRYLASFLYGVRPADPLTFAVVAGLLSLVALLASYLPARRAAKVDPMVALRYE